MDKGERRAGGASSRSIPAGRMRLGILGPHQELVGDILWLDNLEEELVLGDSRPEEPLDIPVVGELPGNLELA